MERNAALCPRTTKLYSGRNATNFFWPGIEMEVDAELKDEWLDRLNSLVGVEIAGTCAGHRDKHKSGRVPNFYFHLAPPLTNADTLISSAMRMAAAIARNLDGSVNVMIPFRRDPNSCYLEFLFRGDVVKMKEGFGPMIDTFLISDRSLLDLFGQLDRKYVPKPRHRTNQFEWDDPVLYVVSDIVHTPANHDAIGRWWLETLGTLEAVVHEMAKR